MTDAPERIWLDWRPGLAVTSGPLASKPRTEYVRADTVAAMVAEARIEELGQACAKWAEVSQSNYQRAKAAEAKLAKAVEALEHAKLNMPHPDQMIDDTPAELKGQDDE